ncbi:1309_t:CDS:1, partial [Cetraspora pellucida]
VNDKTARTQIYKEMLKHLPGVTSVALRIKTLRAKKIHKLFGENGVGMDKIKYVTCSANDISKLTNKQIQNIINQVTSKTIFQGNDQSHMTSKTENNHSYIIPAKSKKLSETEISKEAKKTLPETEVSENTKEISIKNHADQTNAKVNISIDSKKLLELLIKNESDIDALILLL